MDWGVKYRIEWTDILGLDWKVEIEKDEYDSDIFDMQASGEPLVIEYLNNGDDIYENPIKGSIANINIESTNFQYIDLYATEDMEYRMSIYYNSTLFWRGYVITNNYSEPYNTPNFTVTISASDGLGYLKNYIYKYQTIDPDDTYYNGRVLESEIILDILGKIGVTEFKEFVNIYEESMDTGVGDSPFDQIRIDVDIFKDRYCYEVLESILKKYMSIIRQKGGIFYIYRPTELVDTTVYGRYLIGITNKSATTLTPAQYICRTENRTDLRDVNGGTLMIQSPAKKITIYQDYGNKESWVDNWEFLGSTYNSTTYKFDNWTYPGAGVANLINVIKGENDGMILPSSTSGPGATPVAYQEFGYYALATSDDFIIEFEYFFYSAVDTQDLTLYVMIKSNETSHYIYPYDDTEARWNASEDYIDVTETVTGKIATSWTTFRRQINSLPHTGTYTISLFTGHSQTSNAFWGIRNIKFYTTSDKLIPKKVKYYFPFYSQGIPVNLFTKKVVIPRQIIDNKEIVHHIWEATNDITGVNMQYEMMLGDVADADIDNVLEQFSGSLATVTNNYRVDTITLTGGSGTSDITCNGVTKTATWTYDEEGTAEQFVIDYGGSGDDYYLSGVQISYSGVDIIFTALAKGIEFTGDTSITGTITGTVDYTTPASSGIEYSTDWNTRGGSESKELLSIICDELAEQFSRPKQLLTLPIIESSKYSNTPHVDVLGNFQDSSNKIGEDNRIFVFNSGSFNVRDREWNLDLIELI